MRRLFLVLVMAGVLFALPGLAYAATINVPAGQPTIQAAVTAASAGDTIQIAAGTFTETGEIVVNKDLTFSGAGAAATIVKPATDTAVDGSIFKVTAGTSASFNNLTLDGTGRKVWFGINHEGSGGTVAGVKFVNLAASASGQPYKGRGIMLNATGGNWTVSNCAFSGMGRIGVDVQNGAATVSGNSYVGKGAGDWLDYAYQIEYGANVTLDHNTAKDCLGVAYDGSGSSAVAIWSDPGTQATLTYNTFGNSSIGVATVLGFGGDPVVTLGAGNKITGGEFGLTFNDLYGAGAPTVAITGTTIRNVSVDGIKVDAGVSVANMSVHQSTILDNAGYGINNANSGNLDATNNYWGSDTGPTVASNPTGTGQAISTNVLYAPWQMAVTTTSTPASSTWSLVLASTIALAVVAFTARGRTLRRSIG